MHPLPIGGETTTRTGDMGGFHQNSCTRIAIIIILINKRKIYYKWKMGKGERGQGLPL